MLILSPLRQQPGQALMTPQSLEFPQGSTPDLLSNSFSRYTWH